MVTDGTIYFVWHTDVLTTLPIITLDMDQIFLKQFEKIRSLLCSGLEFFVLVVLEVVNFCGWCAVSIFWIGKLKVFSFLAVKYKSSTCKPICYRVESK